MRVQEPLDVVLAVKRSGVQAHGVGKGRVEDAIVGGGDLLEYGGEAVARAVIQRFHGADSLPGEKEQFKRPYCPEGHKRDPLVVLRNDAGLFGELQAKVGREQGFAVGGEVVALREELAGGKVGDVLGGPYLAVRVRIAGAHHGAAVLEDLHVLDLGVRAEVGGLLGPHVHDAADGRQRHGGER